MLAIEEPEARLHPSLQLLLFQKLLEVHKKTGVPIVLETHSIYLLRRLQLAVVKGEVPASSIGLYWVETERYAAKLKRIEMQSDGVLVGWNPETFEEEQRLARDLFVERWRKV